VAKLLAGRGIDVDPASGVLITGSVQEARFVALRSLSESNRVYVPQPAPATYFAGIDFAGATTHEFDLNGPLPAASGGLLIVPDPHQAGGKSIEQTALEGLAAWAVHNELTVIADETLARHFPSAPPDQSLATMPGMASRTVILGSFATPGLAAWQVSWVAGPAELVTTVRDMKQAMTICTPAPGQYAALAGFETAGEG
jgi:N-succinyldiaminopimelate aminotransferase